MELCTKVQQRVLDLETTKTSQALEIDSLKRRVKKFERRKRSRNHMLKRLCKVGLSARVESSKDEGLGEDDASKKGRIADIDVNKDITLVSTHDKQMFDADQDIGGEEVFVAQQDENVVEKEVDASQIQVTIVVTTPTISIEEATLTQALAELKHAKPKAKAKGIFFTVKRAEEKRNKPPTQAQQRKIMCTHLENMKGKKHIDLKNKSFHSIQKMFDRAFKMVNTFVNYKSELVEQSSKKKEAEIIEESSKRVGTKLEKINAKKQKIDDEKEIVELQHLVNIIPYEEGVTIDAIPLAVKPPSIVDWKIKK
nr:hypothetical protein [Tanacetum cinerariifolium]